MSKIVIPEELYEEWFDFQQEMTTEYLLKQQQISLPTTEGEE